MERSLKKFTVSNSAMAALLFPARATDCDVDVKIAVSIMPVKPTAEELFGPAGTPSVAVVGAGFGGIAASVKLKRAGVPTFTVYESSLGIGATWRGSTYARAN